MDKSIEVTVLAFGIAKDILGSSKMQLSVTQPLTVKDLKQIIIDQYPSFLKLASYRIALNAEYADDDTIVKPNDEIVIIPPVSGG